MHSWWKETKEADELQHDNKWTETCWRAMFYTYLTYYGLSSAWDKSWLWNAEEQWINWPFQSVDAEIRQLYVLQLAVRERVFNLFIFIIDAIVCYAYCCKFYFTRDRYISTC